MFCTLKSTYNKINQSLMNPQATKNPYDWLVLLYMQLVDITFINIYYYI